MNNCKYLFLVLLGGLVACHLGAHIAGADEIGMDDLADRFHVNWDDKLRTPPRSHPLRTHIVSLVRDRPLTKRILSETSKRRLESPFDRELTGQQSNRFGFEKTVLVREAVAPPFYSTREGSCGETALAAALWAYGVRFDQDGFDRIGRQINQGNGVDAATMKRFLANTFRVREEEGASLADITAHIDSRNVVMMVVGAGEPREPHWLVAAGYTTNRQGENLGFRIADDGVIGKAVSAAELEHMWNWPAGGWNNYALFLEPGEGLVGDGTQLVSHRVPLDEELADTNSEVPHVEQEQPSPVDRLVADPSLDPRLNQPPSVSVPDLAQQQGVVCPQQSNECVPQQSRWCTSRSRCRTIRRRICRPCPIVSN